MKQRIEAKATLQAINMLHQVYVVEQMDVCSNNKYIIYFIAVTETDTQALTNFL